MEQKIPVLIYHHVDDKKKANKWLVRKRHFKEQMEYLAEEGYKTLTFEHFIDCKRNKKKLSGKNVVITLDDGWKNQYDNAFPVLRKNGFSASFYIITHMLKDSPKAVGDRFKERMSWSQVKKLADSGMEIGSHTQTHPHLARVKDINFEIEGSKHDFLEHEIKVKTFTYPYNSINARVIEGVKTAGYIGAILGNDKRFKRSYTNSHLKTLAKYYAIPAIEVYYETTLEQFGRKLSLY